MSVHQLPEGYKKTAIGLIPEDWDIRAVGDICDCIVPGRNKPKFFKGDIPWITTPDLEEGRSVSESKLGLFVSRDEAKSVGSKIVPVGAVLMSCVGELGIVAFVNREIVINQQLHAFIPTPVVEPFFLLNALQAQKDYMLSIATLTAVPYLNKDNCNSIPIPLPPLPEQRSIAQALSDVDALIAALDKLIAKKRNLKTATMQQLLTGKKRLPGFGEGQGYKQTEVGEIPEDWVLTPLEKISAFITKGSTPTTYGFNWVQNGVLFLRSECVSENGLDLSQSMFISYKAHAVFNRSELRSGDILITITGNVGRVVYLGTDFSVGNMNQHIARVRIISDSVHSGFVYHFLTQSSVRKAFNAITTGQAYPQISLKQVRNTVVPLPSLPEQRAIATVLSDMDAEIAALETRLAKTQALKRGMMQELLTGRTRLV